MKVIAGDWKAEASVIIRKDWLNRPKELWISAGMFKMDKFALGDVVSFDLVTEDNSASMAGKVGWGAAGAFALGPVGLLAGVIAGGNRNDRIMVLGFRDGRKAMVKGNSADAEVFVAATFNNRRVETLTIEQAPVRTGGASHALIFTIAVMVLLPVGSVLLGQNEAASSRSQNSGEQASSPAAVASPISAQGLGALACGGHLADENTLEIDRASSVCDWPFDAEAVSVTCEGRAGIGAVSAKLDGKRYGLNGQGATQYGYLDPVWLNDPQHPKMGIKVDVGPWIKLGLNLC